MINDILSPVRIREEDAAEEQLRPQRCDEFIGQRNLIEKLRIFVQAARQRGEPLDHVLLYGPPGLGKTTLAYIIANELGSKLRTTSGPVLEKKNDLASLLTDLKKGDVLFIDEIHRMNRTVEEFLYPAMEEYTIDIVIGQGPTSKNIKLDIQPFTLVGATTRAGLLTSPLRTRFGITDRLNFYTIEEMRKILIRSARILKVEIEADAIDELAKRSHSTPRIANRLLRRVRDYAQVKWDGKITLPIAHDALVMLEVDPSGLDSTDRLYLETVIKKFQGGPVGVSTIAMAMGEDENTIEDIIEPFLIQLGFVNRTPRGRVISPLAYQHLGIRNPSPSQSSLFQ